MINRLSFRKKKIDGVKENILYSLYAFFLSRYSLYAYTAIYLVFLEVTKFYPRAMFPCIQSKRMSPHAWDADILKKMDRGVMLLGYFH